MIGAGPCGLRTWGRALVHRRGGSHCLLHGTLLAGSCWSTRRSLASPGWARTRHSPLLRSGGQEPLLGRSLHTRTRTVPLSHAPTGRRRLAALAAVVASLVGVGLLPSSDPAPVLVQAKHADSQQKDRATNWRSWLPLHQLAAESTSVAVATTTTAATTNALPGLPKARSGHSGSQAEYYLALLARSLVAARIALSMGLDYKLHWSADLSPADKSVIHTRNARKLLHLCQVNGGIYIKLGQHIASLVYLVPREYCETMIVLQDQCPATTMSEIDGLFRSDLGHGVEELFAYFDPVPLGVASLAQVHRAIDREGRECAIKVQHPALDVFTPMDIETVHHTVTLVKRWFPEFRLDWLADEARDSIPQELDFQREADNCRQSKRLFARDPVVWIPEVYWATRRVLAMEYIAGCRIDQRETLVRQGICPAAVSQRLGDVYGQMIFLHGFIHCDPHPGNILVAALRRTWWDRWRGSPNYRIVILDHGLYRTISDDFRLNYARLWISLIQGDEAGIIRYSYRLFEQQGYDGQVTHRLFASMLTGRSWHVIAGQEGEDFDPPGMPVPSASSEVIVVAETPSSSPSTAPRHTAAPKASRNGGISSVRTERETDLIQQRVPEYLWRISDILARIPRPLLLLLKTNDLLRSVDAALMPAREGAATTSSDHLQRHLLRMTNTMGWYCARAIGGGMEWGLWARLLGLWAYLHLLEFADVVASFLPRRPGLPFQGTSAR